MISIRGLTAQYRMGKETVTALDGIDLEIGAGQVFVLLGPSGCGKTTLLRSLAGLETPVTGQIENRRENPLRRGLWHVYSTGRPSFGNGLSVLRHVAAHERIRQCRVSFKSRTPPPPGE